MAIFQIPKSLRYSAHVCDSNIQGILVTEACGKPVIGGVCLLNTDGGPRPKTTWVLTYIFDLYAVNRNV